MSRNRASCKKNHIVSVDIETTGDCIVVAYPDGTVSKYDSQVDWKEIRRVSALIRKALTQGSKSTKV